MSPTIENEDASSRPEKGKLRRLKDRLDRRHRNKAVKKGSDVDKRLVLGLTDRRIPTTKQMKHLSRFLSPKESATLKILATLIVVSAAILLWRYVDSHIVVVPAEGGEYEEASVGGPHFVNPILTSGNDVDLDIVTLVFSGLMKTGTDGKLVPDLAESYEIADEGKTYTFRLRPGIQWHDGTAFSSLDIAATVGYIKDPAWKSPLISSFLDVGVETPDPTTVIFRLQQPFTPFLSILTMGILPEHLWQDVKAENATRAELNVKPMGTGPFRFKNFSMDKNGEIQTYSLVRNEKYYDKKPYLEKITFTFHENFAEATDTLLSRKVDGLSYLPLEFRGAVEKMSVMKSYTLRLPQYTAIFLNQRKNELLKNKNVRKSLAMAVDKESILQATLGDSGIPVHGPILPGFTGFHADIKKHLYDPIAAAQLLLDEGWELGEDGIRQKRFADDDGDPTPLVVTLVTVDTTENLIVANLIKEQWDVIGVRAELEILASTEIQGEKIRPREYDSLLYGNILGPDSDPFPFWHSSQAEGSGLNLALFSNRRADELLESGRSAADEETRKQQYREFQDILAEEIPAIFLYSPTYAYVVNRRVRGIETSTIFNPADRFADVENWYIETKKAWR